MSFGNYKSANNANGQLLASIGAAAPTVVLSTGQGSLFPTTFPFFAKLEKYDTVLNGSRVLKREIVLVTNRVGDSFTITRSAGACPSAYNSTTQTTTAFQFDPGDTLSNVFTAEQQKDLQDYLATAIQKDGSIAMTGPFATAQGATIPSATTVNLSAATGNSLHISGTTTITSFGSMPQAGSQYTITFDGILTLTHNALSLILPGAANITTASGDVATFVSEGGSNWRCEGYQRANGTAVVAQAIVASTQSSYIAGEALSTGNSVYISSADGKAYKTVGTDNTKIAFVGFVVLGVSIGASVLVDTAGMSATQTGLTANTNYFVGNTAGTITTTPGTFLQPIGFSTNTTTIYIEPQRIRAFVATASANLVQNLDSLKTTVSLSMVKLREARVNVAGTVRVTSSVWNPGATGTCQVYKNGVAAGAGGHTGSATEVVYTDDISVVPGDLIQLYCQTNNGSNACQCQQFRFSYDKTVATGEINSIL